MDDDALYHNLATVGSNAADIDSQIKAFQSMNTVQGSKFNADDTLFVIGSGEAAVVSPRELRFPRRQLTTETPRRFRRQGVRGHGAGERPDEAGRAAVVYGR